MTYGHKHPIMICTHVLEDNEPIGEMDDDIKSDTMICQKCCDQLCKEPSIENLPKELHYACKHCVLQQLQNTIRKIRLIKKGDKDAL